MFGSSATKLELSSAIVPNDDVRCVYGQKRFAVHMNVASFVQ